jgi:hypothetical protein
MIPADRGLAALAGALADHLGDAQAASYIYARAILGDRAVFLPDGDCGHDPKGEAAAREFVESITVDCGHKATIAALRAVGEIVRRHTHQGLYAMTLHAGPDPERDCHLCRALVAAGVLTLGQIGASTRAALAAQEADHDLR